MTILLFPAKTNKSRKKKTWFKSYKLGIKNKHNQLEINNVIGMQTHFSSHGIMGNEGNREDDYTITSGNEVRLPVWSSYLWARYPPHLYPSRSQRGERNPGSSSVRRHYPQMGFLWEKSNKYTLHTFCLHLISLLIAKTSVLRLLEETGGFIRVWRICNLRRRIFCLSCWISESLSPSSSASSTSLRMLHFISSMAAIRDSEMLKWAFSCSDGIWIRVMKNNIWDAERKWGVCACLFQISTAAKVLLGEVADQTLTLGRSAEQSVWDAVVLTTVCKHEGTFKIMIILI